MFSEYGFSGHFADVSIGTGNIRDTDIFLHFDWLLFSVMTLVLLQGDVSLRMVRLIWVMRLNTSMAQCEAGLASPP